MYYGQGILWSYASLWSNAHNAKIIDMFPTDYGWTDVNGKLEMTWFVDDQLPQAYEDVVITPDILRDTQKPGEPGIFSGQ